MVAVGTMCVGAVAQSESTTGVTSKAVKLGYLYSGTGVASALFADAAKACQARIDRANASGGANGRKIELEIIDDQSGAGNLTAAKDLVENRDVFAVLNNSSFGFLTYRYLLEAKVPGIGPGYDGNYYSAKGNENVINMSGPLVPEALNYDTVPTVMKQLGGKKTAAIAYGASASSSAAAKTMQEYAVPAVPPLEAVYTNTSVDFGSTDVGPIALGIKNAGADSVYLPLQSSTNIAIVDGLAQNGVEMKANVMGSGYGQALLDAPVAKNFGKNTVVFSNYTPVELKTKATKQFQADLKKYSGITGVPDYGDYTGYIMCDLAVRGLEKAGKDLTRQKFIDGIRSIDSYDQAGLACQPANLTVAAITKSPAKNCQYYLYVKDGKFVIMNNGKPYRGNLVGSKEALAANAAGDNTTVTTTTAPPAP